jgi:methyltransferase-like protein
MLHIHAVDVPLDSIDTGFLNFVSETEMKVISLKSSILSQFVYFEIHENYIMHVYSRSNGYTDCSKTFTAGSCS